MDLYFENQLHKDRIHVSSTIIQIEQKGVAVFVLICWAKKERGSARLYAPLAFSKYCRRIIPDDDQAK